MLIGFVVGGLTAVIWTDFVQTILMIIGAVTLAIMGEQSLFQCVENLDVVQCRFCESWGIQ